MRKYLYTIAALFVVGVVSLWLYEPPNRYNDGPTVKISAGSGHGSATHIGGGFFVTAAHVVGAKDTMNVKTDGGQLGSATVLWSNKEYDIALIHSNIKNIDAASIDCRTPKKHEEVRMSGNPVNIEFIDTWGRVAGSAIEARPQWANVITVDGTLGPGMSGGGVFDADGDLVGVNVGGVSVPIGFSASLIPISFVVPAETVCFLMGRY